MERTKALIGLIILITNVSWSQNVRIRGYEFEKEVNTYTKILKNDGVEELLVYQTKKFKTDTTETFIFWKYQSRTYGTTLKHKTQRYLLENNLFDYPNKKLGVSKDEDTFRFVPPFHTLLEFELVIYKDQYQSYYFELGIPSSYSPDELKQKNRNDWGKQILRQALFIKQKTLP